MGEIVRPVRVDGEWVRDAKGRILCGRFWGLRTTSEVEADMQALAAALNAPDLLAEVKSLRGLLTEALPILAMATWDATTQEARDWAKRVLPLVHAALGEVPTR